MVIKETEGQDSEVNSEMLRSEEKGDGVETKTKLKLGGDLIKNKVSRKKNKKLKL